MNRTQLMVTIAALVCVPSLARSVTPAPPRAYAQIVGAKQGTFKGEATRIAGTNYIAVLAFNYQITSPTDAATGLPTGKPKHQPIVITKTLDATSPQIYSALVSNETLTKVTIEFMTPPDSSTGAAGSKEIPYYTITLTNARISDVHQHMDQTNPGATGSSIVPTEPMEDVSITFEQITVASAVGQTTAADSWSSKD